MKVFALLFCAITLHAAEPDWAALDKYAVDLLQRYLRIPTINPPANTKAAAEMLKAEFEKHGFAVKLYPSGPAGQTNLFTRLAGRDRSKKPLVLLNHMDVVPVDAKAWSVDPFGGVIRDGFIWGRGALDMKGIAVEQMVALIALKQAGVAPSRDIVMFSSADEESSGIFGIRWMIENHPDEIDGEYSFDEGGVATRDLLAPNRLIFGVTVGEKQMVWIKLRVKGTAGHGSQPIPDNANSILMEAIRKAMAAPPATKTDAVVAEMQSTIGEMAKNKFTAAIQGNTMTLTTLRSGVGDPPKPNVIPSAAEATIDCRLLPGVNAEEFLSEIRARINDPHVTVERLSTVPDPGPSKTKTPLFEVIRAAVKKQHPDAVVSPILVPYGTDSVHLRNKGVTAYGLVPMVLDAATMATMHSDEERIPLSEFLKGIRIFYDVLRSDF
ncbi:MAG TPA: M20/M25/M40 family metallo-hydrolase [Bryobacteraceae bacterium]|nr:M20/M25/M40 family metallo-hydrolase [Bryobacteraceae bacterium]